MKNNKGFTLIELLAVIVVLAIVMVLAVTTVLPYMNNAREEAFRIEATSLVDAAEKAKDLYVLEQISIDNNTKSCSSATKVCFTVEKLIELGIYEGDTDVYSGEVLIENYSSKNPTYNVSIKKNNEFKIINGTAKDYTNNDVTLSDVDWKDEYSQCSCS